MTIEQRVAVLEEIFAKLRDYYILLYSGEEIDALLASAGVPIGITKEYDSVSAMNDDFSSTDVTRGQFVLILTTDTSSEDYGKVYLKGSANWVYVFTLTSLTAIKGPQGPAGKTGAKGADGADGKNFMVLGYYETLSALNAAVPSPEAGDTYGVGTEPPYAFYMYDQTISNWRYVGNLQGPAGPIGGEDNFVRYDAAQTLTDAQKTQARSNIGAAPDEYGLGGIGQLITDFDNAKKNGWYYAAAGALNSPDGNFAWACHVQNLGNADIFVQDAYAISNVNAYLHRRRLVYIDTATQDNPWEWVDPPMATGQEYRTTERYLGKPVYCKVVDFGAVPPANTTKRIGFGGGNGSVDYIISWVGNVSVVDNSFVLPYDEVGNRNDTPIRAYMTLDGLSLFTESDWFADNKATAKYTVWYTKKAD